MSVNSLISTIELKPYGWLVNDIYYIFLNGKVASYTSRPIPKWIVELSKELLGK